MAERWSALEALQNPEPGSESEELDSSSEVSRHVYHLEQRILALERLLEILNNQLANCLERLSRVEHVLPLHLDRVTDRVVQLEESDSTAEQLLQHILARLSRLERVCQLNTLD